MINATIVIFYMIISLVFALFVFLGIQKEDNNDKNQYAKKGRAQNFLNGKRKLL